MSSRSHSSKSYGNRREESSSSRRRSPSPKRRSSDVPKEFGRSESSSRRDTDDDNQNVLQRMHSVTGPLELLKECRNNKKEIKVWTRNYKEIRGVCTGKLEFFDKHWNLIISGLEEVFLKRKKSKTPFLKAIEKDEEIPAIPEKTPREKGSKSKKDEGAVKIKQEEIDEEASDAAGEGKKKRKKCKKKSSVVASREAKGLYFIRGDNIVMVAYKPKDDDKE